MTTQRNMFCFEYRARYEEHRIIRNCEISIWQQDCLTYACCKDHVRVHGGHIFVDVILNVLLLSDTLDPLLKHVSKFDTKNCEMEKEEYI